MHIPEQLDEMVVVDVVLVVIQSNGCDLGCDLGHHSARSGHFGREVVEWDGRRQREVVVARVIFVNGFNRSGTTLVTKAATEASGGTTLTVGHLARHMPAVAEFLAAARGKGAVPDRGVDRLPADESMPEEYGWLINAKTGAFTFSAEAAGIVRMLVDELVDDSRAPVVVLKNPWDTGQEQLLLDSFADSRVLLIRREVGSIEDSLGRAWSRLATSNEYVQALVGNPKFAAQVVDSFADPKTRQEQIDASRAKTRDGVLRLIRNADTLPLDRVAFLSYDELRRDPYSAARWAGHVVDADAFAKAVSAFTFPEYNQVESGAPEVHELDNDWEQAWQRARERQVDAGIVR
jgi:hypothetical protein